MKSILLCFGLIILAINVAFGQVKEIPEAGIKLELPGKEWRLGEHMDQKKIVMYMFVREALIDSSDRKVVPTISVVVENVSQKTDAIAYSAIKRMQVPFDVDEVFTWESGTINFKNAIAYQGRYTDNGISHTIYVVHAVNKKKGIQVIFDTTTQVLNQVDKEFQGTLKSISLIE